MPPLTLSLFKNLMGLAFLGLTLAASKKDLEQLRTLSLQDWLILAGSGTLGIAAADTIVFYALNRVGVGLVTIAECVYSPAVFLFAWVLLGEKITPPVLVGGMLVIVAILFATRHRGPVASSGDARAAGDVAWGMAAAAFAVTLTALGITIAKPVLGHTPLILAAAIRVAGGTAVLTLVMAATPSMRPMLLCLQPCWAWLMAIPASFLGTYLSMLCWVAGFKYTSSSVAAILNQTSTIFALLMATFFLKEPLTRRKVFAVALALTGVAMVLQPW